MESGKMSEEELERELRSLAAFYPLRIEAIRAHIAALQRDNDRMREERVLYKEDGAWLLIAGRGQRRLMNLSAALKQLSAFGAILEGEHGSESDAFVYWREHVEPMVQRIDAALSATEQPSK